MPSVRLGSPRPRSKRPHSFENDSVRIETPIKRHRSYSPVKRFNQTAVPQAPSLDSYQNAQAQRSVGKKPKTCQEFFDEDVMPHLGTSLWHVKLSEMASLYPLEHDAAMRDLYTDWSEWPATLLPKSTADKMPARSPGACCEANVRRRGCCHTGRLINDMSS